MTSDRDVALNASLFHPSAIPEACHKFNSYLSNLTVGQPKWFEIGAQTFREKRLKGETIFPKPELLECAKSLNIPSRDAGRNIPCRFVKPEGDSPPAGVFMHIHGGGWVLGDEIGQDTLLNHYATTANLVAITVGYRLAPEDPFPAGPEDCYDAAKWLIDNAEAEFGAPLKFIGGESAGGHLSALTALHLLSHENPKYSDFKFNGLVLHYGAYDLSRTPSTYTFKRDPPLLLGQNDINQFLNAFLPDNSLDRKDPSVSPLYFDFPSLIASGKSLPPAVFTCGTEDMLLDDTIFMSAKWQMAGGETLVKILPGAPHGFTLFPDVMPGVKETVELTIKFLKEKTHSETSPCLKN